MKKLGVISLCAVLFCLAVLAAAGFSRTVAKRKAPPRVPPVIIGNMEYRVPNTIATEGVVEAWDTNSHKMLWNLKIYSTLKFPSFFMETDVQFNFITNMTVGPASEELTIGNERGKYYILNTKSRKAGRK